MYFLLNLYAFFLCRINTAAEFFDKYAADGYDGTATFVEFLQHFCAPVEDWSYWMEGLNRLSVSFSAEKYLDMAITYYPKFGASMLRMRTAQMAIRKVVESQSEQTLRAFP